MGPHVIFISFFSNLSIHADTGASACRFVVPPSRPACLATKGAASHSELLVDASRRPVRASIRAGARPLSAGCRSQAKLAEAKHQHAAARRPCECRVGWSVCCACAGRGSASPTSAPTTTRHGRPHIPLTSSPSRTSARSSWPSTIWISPTPSSCRPPAATHKSTLAASASAPRHHLHRRLHRPPLQRGRPRRPRPQPHPPRRL